MDTYEDAAISGSSTLNRGGIQRLISDAEAKRFDMIVTESLDRLSRNQADIAALYEKFTFLGVRIETLADGLITELHVGLKGTMSALFLKDLAQKTRRGQVGRVKAGSSGRQELRLRHCSNWRGTRTTCNQRSGGRSGSARVWGICGGQSPLSIVQDFNKEGIKGPLGGLWNSSTLLGSPKRRNGVLNNELYRGIMCTIGSAS